METKKMINWLNEIINHEDYTKPEYLQIAIKIKNEIIFRLVDCDELRADLDSVEVEDLD